MILLESKACLLLTLSLLFDWFLINALLLFVVIVCSIAMVVGLIVLVVCDLVIGKSVICWRGSVLICCCCHTFEAVVILVLLFTFVYSIMAFAVAPITHQSCTVIRCWFVI